MEFRGRYQIAAPPQAVWDGLFDPELLRQCLPGCETLEKTGPADFAASLRLKIGPMKALFHGKLSLRDADPPYRCILAGEGQGGVAGFAKGEAALQLAPQGDGTELTYTAEAHVGGKLAQIGQRLIDGAARQIADQFFAAFAKVVAHEKASENSPPAPAPVGGAGADRLSPVIWMTGLGAVVLILVLMLMVVR